MGSEGGAGQVVRGTTVFSFSIRRRFSSKGAMTIGRHVICFSPKDTQCVVGHWCCNSGER